MAAPSIVMYAKKTCPYCHMAERLLRDRGVDYINKILIDEQPQRRQEMLARSGGRTTVPQLFIDDQHIGGCDDLMALDAAGGLEPMLSARTGSNAPPRPSN